MNSADPFLEARDLTVVRGGSQVLRIPTFSLKRSETVALIGPNGTGKSSFLLTLAGLLPLASGEIHFKQHKIVPGYASTDYRRKMSMVFQEPLLFDTTVYENVAAGLKMRHMPKQQINEQVTACLERFRITHLAQRSARKLSGGEAQRTSLARAFATNPEMILLDEPFVALDPPSRLALSDDLESVLKETGISAILTTHEQTEALRLADRIVVMQQGNIIQSGSPTEIMDQPASEFVATFVGMENILSGSVCHVEQGLFSLHVSGQTLRIVGSATLKENAVICIHPDQVVVSLANHGPDSSSRNVLCCTVVKIIQMGLFTKLYLDCGFKLIASITNQSLERLTLHIGSQVFASFKATAVHVFRKG
jgi:tungstate transport system ATP-binding protein